MSNSWKEAWKGKQMDRWAREEKRAIKKGKHKENRRNCKRAIENGDYENDNVNYWDDLDAKDKTNG